MVEQLRKATEQSHQALEGFLIPVIKHIYTVQEYKKLLTMFYGFYKPVEESLDAFPIIRELPDYGQRRKAQLIINDLHALGDNPPVRLCNTVPAISTMEDAFGAMYVLEGSTLGGMIIMKMLQRNLSPDTAEAYTFFTGYGHETGSKWAAFKKVLAAFCSEPQKYNRVSATANQTFTQLKTWAGLIYQYECTKEKF